MKFIDLNADLGEGKSSDAELLGIVSSCNIACGGHAGDADSMQVTITTAAANDVAVGAHPSYPDREGFGRRRRFLTGDALRSSLQEQLQALRNVALENGTMICHVKPHGALYSDAAVDRELAEIVVAAVTSSVPDAAIVGLPNSKIEEVALSAGMPFVSEGFVDRAYQENGRLVPRSEPGAVHACLDKITGQAVALVGTVDTLCIHGDTPGAVEAAKAVRKVLQESGVEIRAISRR